MPELPEVETMRRGILGILGGRIEKLHWLRRPLKPIATQPSRPVFRRRVLGQQVVAVDRIGKRVVIRLGTGDSIVVEPRMTGLVLLGEPPNESHLRWHMQLTDTTANDVWYWDRRGLGSVRLFTPESLQQTLGPDCIGPDALTVTPKVLQNQFSTSRREIKVALLDQHRLAGMGNIYVSEVLHMARIHPGTPCNQLRGKEWQILQRCMRQVLEDAIAHEGSTLSDGTYRNALNQSGNYQNQHRVYAREKLLCMTCHSTQIVRIVQAQRSTFYCPHCQTKRRSRSPGRK